MKLRKSIPMPPGHDRTLRSIYHQFSVAVDQLPKDPRRWGEFTAIFNDATGRSESKEDLLHYMVTQRKRGRWERLGASAVHVDGHTYQDLSEDQVEMLKGIYIRLGVASDRYNQDRGHRQRLQREFAALSGEGLSATALVDALIGLRKDRKLPPLGRQDGEGAVRVG